jgi:hypothetical protein
VAALSAYDVWAAGYSGSLDPAFGCCNDTLIQHWDGNTWSTLQSPNPPDGRDNRLYSIAAVSPDDVWAVGFSGTGTFGTLRTLILHWNGAKWSIMPSPNAGSNTPNALYGVAAVSPNDVWAVGWTGNNASSQTLVIHWDGITWSIVPSPNSNLSVNRLYAIAAISADDIWAVGSAELYNVPSGVLALHWDGTGWTLARTPSAGVKSALYSVSAVGPDDVWAVGAGDGRGLAMHFDGTAWRTIEPQDQPAGTIHWGVHARAANDVWLVGQQSFDGSSHALVHHWNGKEWRPVPAAEPAASRSFYAVAAPYPDTAWAVGSYYGTANLRSHSQTLVQRYDGPSCRDFDFADVQLGDYFYEPLKYLYTHDIVSGYADGTFRPYANTTRAQLTKIIVLAKGWTISMADGPHFVDVGPDHAFYPYIETARSRGIISGYQDGTFRPDASITRGQLAKAVALAAGWTTNTSAAPHFSDVPQGHHFYPYVESAYNQDIVAGYRDDTLPSNITLFRPDDFATRGHIAKIVHRATLTTPYNENTRGRVAAMLVSDYHLQANTWGGPHFIDVTPQHPHYTPIETLYNLTPSCIAGYEDGTFRPSSTITRGSLADLLACVQTSNRRK